MELGIEKTECVAIAGAGAMGRGIALVAAGYGHEVVLYDAFDGVAESAIKHIKSDFDRLVKKNKYTEIEVNNIVNRIKASSSLSDLAPAKLVVEAIVENIDIKRTLFLELEGIVSDSTLLTTNTSSLSVTEISKTLSNPKRFAGFHFFNPANRMPLVEVVRGTESSENTISLLVDTAKAWGKTPVICKSRPGFIVNRVARPFYGEALRLLEENATDHVAIDTLIKECGGFKMGPLELTDLIGQDVNYSVTKSVYESFSYDPRYKPSIVQLDLVHSGRLGRKSGSGFYRYDVPSEASSESLISDQKTPPKKIKLVGSSPVYDSLTKLTESRGIQIEKENVAEESKCFIQIEDIKLVLTDGRLATERGLGEGDVCVFDFAFDYESTSSIGVSFNDGVSQINMERAVGFFQALGKAVYVIDDVAGMVVMSTIAMIINEAVDAFLQKLATENDIDLAMQKGVNYPGGPFSWLNSISASHVLCVLDNLNRIYPSGRYRASSLLRRRAINEIKISTS